MGKIERIKRKRRGDAPKMSPKKVKAPPGEPSRARLKERLEARTTRFRTIYARTAAGRAQLDAACEGADMDDLNHLPVIETKTGEPYERRTQRYRPPEDEEEVAEVVDIPRPPIAPPVALEMIDDDDMEALPVTPGRTGRRCSACGLPGHRRDNAICQGTDGSPPPAPTEPPVTVSGPPPSPPPSDLDVALEALAGAWSLVRFLGARDP